MSSSEDYIIILRSFLCFIFWQVIWVAVLIFDRHDIVEFVNDFSETCPVDSKQYQSTLEAEKE